MKFTVKLSSLLLAFLIFSHTTIGQVSMTKEWFGQKNTQREYLLNQIAALQVYIGYAKKGYEIYDKGLNLIGSFTNGEFNLHNDFFLSLKGINPEIARYAKVAATIQLQYQLRRSCSQTMRSVRDSNWGADRIVYVNRVFGKVIIESEELLKELITLTTASKLALTDDERLKRIDMLHEEMATQFQFVQQFGEEALFIEKSNSAAQKHIELNKKLNSK